MFRAFPYFRSMLGEFFIQDCCQVDQSTIAVLVGIKNQQFTYFIALVNVITGHIEQTIGFPKQGQGFEKVFDTLRLSKLSITSIKMSKLVVVVHAFAGKQFQKDLCTDGL